MRKTILLLINGFGIEKKDSMEIYTSALMPNMDFMTKNYLFGSIAASATDYNNAYKSFSMKEKSSGAEDQIDRAIYEHVLNANQVLNVLSNQTNNKIHVFYTLNRGEKFHQLREILKTINLNKNKKVFVHIVLTSNSINDYGEIEKAMNKLSFELSEYCTLGMIVGSNQLQSDDTMRMIYKEFGEHWNESNKKIAVYKRDIINPVDATPFFVNSGFAVQPGDIVMFANFTDISVNRVYTELSKMNVNWYSLYEQDGFINAFNREKSENTSISEALIKNNIKLLVLADANNINNINFYLNGMQNKLCQNITYAILNIGLFSTKESVIKLIENNSYDGIILDFDIGKETDVENIKATLNRIDSIIKPISDASKEKNYTFIISSLYGMYAQVMDGVVPKIINFQGKVPVIYQNNEFTKVDYSLNSTNTYGLGETFLTNICDDVKANRLVHQLSKLEKMFRKK